MPVPDFFSFTLPVLRLADKGESKLTDAVDQIATEFALTDEEREETVRSGRQTKIYSRVVWSLTYLVKAGLAERPRRGHFVITPKGKEVLANPPERIDIPYLRQFDKFVTFQATTRESNVDKTETTEDLTAGTPEERVEEACEELNAALRDDLLDRILEMHPSAFEKLIVDLMLGMGYGARGSGEQIGRTGDGGIDGIINEDKLGLDLIYLQAKRYAPGSTIGVDQIRSFSGALDDHSATKGVFVTTSHFATGAMDYAKRSPKRLILIDGEKLTQLMVDHDVAVRDHSTFKIKKVDTDYFDDAEG